MVVFFTVEAEAEDNWDWFSSFSFCGFWFTETKKSLTFIKKMIKFMKVPFYIRWCRIDMLAWAWKLRFGLEVTDRLEFLPCFKLYDCTLCKQPQSSSTLCPLPAILVLFGYQQFAWTILCIVFFLQFSRHSFGRTWTVTSHKCHVSQNIGIYFYRNSYSVKKNKKLTSNFKAWFKRNPLTQNMLFLKKYLPD